MIENGENEIYFLDKRQLDTSIFLDTRQLDTSFKTGDNLCSLCRDKAYALWATAKAGLHGFINKKVWNSAVLMMLVFGKYQVF